MPKVRFEKSFKSAFESLEEDEVLHINSRSLIEQVVVDVHIKDGEKLVMKDPKTREKLGSEYFTLTSIFSVANTVSIRKPGKVEELLGVFLLKGEKGPLEELKDYASRARGKIPEAIEKALVRELGKISSTENLCLIIKGKELLEKVEEKIGSTRGGMIKDDDSRYHKSVYPILKNIKGFLDSLERNVKKSLKYEPSEEEEEILNVVKEEVEKSESLTYNDIVSERETLEIRIPMEFMAKHIRASFGEGEEAERRIESLEGFNQEDMWKVEGRVGNFLVVRNKSLKHQPNPSLDTVDIILELEPIKEEEKAKAVLIPFAYETSKGPDEEKVVRVRMIKAFKRKVSRARVEARITVDGNNRIVLGMRAGKEKVMEWKGDNVRKLAEVEIEEVEKKLGLWDYLKQNKERKVEKLIPYLENNGRMFSYKEDSLEVDLLISDLYLNTSSKEMFRVSILTDGKRRRAFARKVEEGKEEKGMEKNSALIVIKAIPTRLNKPLYWGYLVKQLVKSKEFLDTIKEVARESVQRALKRSEKKAKNKEEEKIFKWKSDSLLKILEKILEEKRVQESLESQGALVSSEEEYDIAGKEEKRITISQVTHPKGGEKLLTEGVEINGLEKRTNLLRPEVYMVDESLCFRTREGEKVKVERNVWRDVEVRLLGEEEVREIDEMIKKGGILPSTYLALLHLISNGTIDNKSLSESPEDLMSWKYIKKVSEAIEKTLTLNLGTIKKSIGEETSWEEGVVPVIRIRESEDIHIKRYLDKTEIPESVEIELESFMQVTGAGIKIDLGKGEFLEIMIPWENEIDLEYALTG